MSATSYIPASGVSRLRLLIRLDLPIGLSLAACGLLGSYQSQTVALASPWLLGVCAAAASAALLAPGPIFWVMTSRVDRNAALAESTRLAVMASGISSVVPLHAGGAARAVYLNRRHDLDLSAFAATFLGYNIPRLFAAAVAACSTGGWLLLSRDNGGPALLGPSSAKLSTYGLSGLEGLVFIAGALALAAIGACLVRPAWLGRLGFGELE